MNIKLLTQSMQFGPTDSPNSVHINGPLDPRITDIGSLITRILEFLVPFASIILFLVLVAGGFDVLTSQGSAEKLKSGRAKITAGIIGFFLIVFAFVLAKMFGFFLGLGTDSPL